jgi:DNA-binding CsgD family transcriptional regulator
VYTIVNAQPTTTQTNNIEITVTDDMLNNMTKEQREVVVMRMEGMSFRAISYKLEMSEMGVRTRYNRAFDALLKGRTAQSTSTNNVGELTDEQVNRFELLNELKSIQKVADKLDLNQMSVRSSLGRAALKLGCDSIWEALNTYNSLKEKAARDAHGTQLGFDLSEVGTIETSAPVTDEPKRRARK